MNKTGLINLRSVFKGSSGNSGTCRWIVVFKGSDVDPMPRKGKIIILKISHWMIFLFISLHDAIFKSSRFKQVLFMNEFYDSISLLIVNKS